MKYLALIIILVISCSPNDDDDSVTCDDDCEDLIEEYCEVARECDDSSYYDDLEGCIEDGIEDYEDTRFDYDMSEFLECVQDCSEGDDCDEWIECRADCW